MSAPEPNENTPPAPWWRRLAWFVGLWLLGVGVLSLVAYAIRLVIFPG